MRPERILRLTLLLALSAGAAPANDIQTSGSFVSTVAPGTPPLEVASTTRVDNLNAEFLDGWGASSFLRPLDNVITVSPSGGDFTSIQAALDSITDASTSNRYVVQVGPGVYYEKITLKSWVSVVGSGKNSTRIIGDGSNIFGFAGTVTGADYAGLSHAFVWSDATDSNSYSIGIYIDGTQPDLHDLRILADSGTVSSIGLYNSNNELDLRIRDVEVGAIDSPEAIGILNASADLTIQDSEVFGYAASVNDYALLNAASSGSYLVIVKSTRLEGDLWSDSEFTTYLSRVDVVGTSLTGNGGSIICAFVVDSSGTAYPDTCP